MTNPLHFNTKFKNLLDETKAISSIRLSDLLQYSHASMVRITIRILGPKEKRIYGDILLSPEEVIRLIMSLPEYNSSFVSYAKFLLAQEMTFKRSSR